MKTKEEIDALLARVAEVREAILCLRGVLLEEQEDPAFFERVFREEGEGKADWVMCLGGERFAVIEHNEYCPILSALEDILY